MLIKLLAFRQASNLLTETPIQVISCEYCNIFTNTYFGKNVQNGCFCGIESELKKPLPIKERVFVAVKNILIK